MNEPSPRVWMASLAALTPAVLGALGLTRVLAMNQNAFQIGSLTLGILCGGVVLFVGQSRSWAAMLSAGVTSIVGMALTFIFNAKWNTADHLADQFVREHGLDPAAALQQAKTMLGGMTLMELMQANWHSSWILAALFAAVAGVLTTQSRLIGRVLGVPSSGKG